MIEASMFAIKSYRDPYIKYCNCFAITNNTLMAEISCKYYLHDSIIISIKTDPDEKYKYNEIYRPLKYAELTSNFIIFTVNYTNLIPVKINITDIYLSDSLDVYASNFALFPKSENLNTYHISVAIVGNNECDIWENFDTNNFGCYKKTHNYEEIVHSSGALSSIIMDYDPHVYPLKYYIIGLGSSVFTRDSNIYSTAIFKKFDKQTIDRLYNYPYNYSWITIDSVDKIICETCKICEDCETCNSSQLSINFAILIFVFFYLFL
jgi:hypothetical protein